MRAGHLLVVPDGVTPADVQALVLSRFPSTDPADGVAPLAMEVLPGCVVEGPDPVPDPAPAGMPAWAAASYLLEAPEHRRDPVPAELQGRGGVLDAFAEGEPGGTERELLELGMAMARRLGGALLTSTAVLLTPPPQPDLLLYSEIWLHPDALVHVLAPHLPGVAMAGDDPGTTAAGELPAGAVTGTSLVADEGERRWLHAEADAYDAAALSEPDLTDSYGVLATEPDGTVWSVTVEEAVGVPPVLAGLLPAGAILYEVRCYPAGPATQPASNAVERIDGATRALLEAVGGHVVDDDGFLVTLS